MLAWSASRLTGVFSVGQQRSNLVNAEAHISVPAMPAERILGIIQRGLLI